LRRSAALLAPAWLVLGCVTAGTHDDVVRERDALAARVEMLEASTQSLSDERVELMEQLEDLRLAHESASRELAELERRRDELESTLAARESTLEARTAEIERLRGTYDELVGELETEVTAGRLEIERLREGVRMNLSSEVLFAPGQAQLSPEGRRVLADVARRLERVPHRVEVRGHTDDQGLRAPPVASASNWDLACLRAAGVVRALEAAGVDASRLSAVSLGEHQPVGDNATPQGRAQNRRIELRLLPQDADAPPATAPPPQDG